MALSAVWSSFWKVNSEDTVAGSRNAFRTELEHDIHYRTRNYTFLRVITDRGFENCVSVTYKHNVTQNGSQRRSKSS